MSGTTLSKDTGAAWAAPALWRAVFGKTAAGYLCAASGQRHPGSDRLADFQERYFHYPGEADQATRWCADETDAGREVYFCAHLLTEPRRSKETAAPLSALYADGDGAEFNMSFPEPSVVVESSPGRTQLYWTLSEAVEPGTGERLNRRLAYATGADMSGWDLTQLLRVPGTANHKYPDVPVVALREATGEVHDPERLDRELPEPPEEVHEEALAEPVSREMSDDEILKRCREAGNAEKFVALYDEGNLDEYGGDHSAADQALVGILSFYTQDQEQIDRLFRRSGLMRPKWAEREDYRKRTISKALTQSRDYFGATRQGPNVVFVDDFEGENGATNAANVTDAAAGADSVGEDRLTNATNTTNAGDGGRALPPAPPFPVDALPPALGRFVREAADSLVCRPEFVAMPMLATLSSAAGASRVFRVKGKWKAYPSLWIAIVAPPSAKKTPGWEVATEPAQDRQAEAARRWEAEKEDYEEALRAYEAKKKALKKGEVPPKPPEEPRMEHTLAQDATVEALAVMLSENPRGVLIAHDELSAFFRQMDQYKSGGKGSDRQKYLSLWSSTLIKVDRKKDDPILVRTPVVSVAGSLQPAVVEDMYKAGSQGGDDGMIHRFLVSYPEPLRLLDDWSDEEISHATEFAYRLVYEGLRNLQPRDDGSPAPVLFTTAGRERFRAEKRTINAEMLRPGFADSLQYAWGKLDGQLARLALLFCLVRTVTEGTEEAVNEEDVERAARLISYFRAHTKRVHALLRQESKEGRLLGVLGEFLGDQPGGVWKGRSADLRRILLDRGVHDVPDRPEDLSAKLLRLSEKTDGLTVKRGWIGKERAITVALTPLSPAAGVGDVGSVGADNVDGSTAEPIKRDDKSDVA